MSHVLDVGTEIVGEVRELVHERDARCEHRVGRILGELGGADVHDEQSIVIAHERRVHRAQRRDRALVGRTDHDAVRFHEILDRRTLLQEFRVRGYGEVELDAAGCKLFGDGTAHAIRGSNRHRRLVDDDLGLRHPAPDAARGREHVLHVGGAVLVGRRTDGDELHARRARPPHRRRS